MPFISIHQGQTVLITEETGQINWPSDKGLYFFDTRVVSSWTIYANGEPWELLNGGAISYYASRIFLTNRSLPTEEGTIPPRTLSNSMASARRRRALRMTLALQRATSGSISCRSCTPRSSATTPTSRFSTSAQTCPKPGRPASSFMLTQALLGFLPDAPRNKMYVDPSLPSWLPDLTMHDLRVGKHEVDIRFWREDKQTAFEVIKGDPKLVERCDVASKVAQLRTGSDPI
jgi:hypothetical protein